MEFHKRQLYAYNELRLMKNPINPINLINLINTVDCAVAFAYKRHAYKPCVAVKAVKAKPERL